MSKKHKKHITLEKTIRGIHHPREWAIYGTNCDEIRKIYEGIRRHVQYSSVFIDADHDEALYSSIRQIGKKRYINHTKSTVFDFDDHLESQIHTYAIINGNHYSACKQIVVIDEQKKNSLRRRLKQLTDIQIVITDNTTKIYDFVKEKMNEKTKIIHPDRLTKLHDFLRQAIKKSLPKLKALVLAGGVSARMGIDKSQINYHDKPQEIYAAELCNSLGMPTYISKAAHFESDIINEFPIIKDTFINLGPMGAILSAFREDPNAAWFVLACDLPLLSKKSIKQLIKSRDVNKYATSYSKYEEAFPEPLVTIYEPSSYGRLLQFLNMGYACPRKALINSDVQKVIIHNADELINVNVPEDRALIECKLRNDGSL